MILSNSTSPLEIPSASQEAASHQLVVGNSQPSPARCFSPVPAAHPSRVVVTAWFSCVLTFFSPYLAILVSRLLQPQSHSHARSGSVWMLVFGIELGSCEGFHTMTHRFAVFLSCAPSRVYVFFRTLFCVASLCRFFVFLRSVSTAMSC